MTTAISHLNTNDLEKDDYVVIGLATCFTREDGEVRELEVMEPIPSANLEVLFKGIATSYKFIYATTIGNILDGDTVKIPKEFPQTVQLAEDFVERVMAAARTYKRKESAKSLLMVGKSYTDLQYSTERKRVLNAARNVSKEDNVKQHSHTHKVL
ncbi:MAG: hypothetical protein AAF378_08415 [Cyanobacteria bacterium P01_A01_bin.84]